MTDRNSAGRERAGAEKSQRVFTTAEWRKEQRDKKKAEEAEWASKNGPVEIRRKSDG